MGDEFRLQSDGFVRSCDFIKSIHQHKLKFKILCGHSKYGEKILNVKKNGRALAANITAAQRYYWIII